MSHVEARAEPASEFGFLCVEDKPTLVIHRCGDGAAFGGDGSHVSCAARVKELRWADRGRAIWQFRNRPANEGGALGDDRAGSVEKDPVCVAGYRERGESCPAM